MLILLLTTTKQLNSAVLKFCINLHLADFLHLEKKITYFLKGLKNNKVVKKKKKL